MINTAQYPFTGIGKLVRGSSFGVFSEGSKRGPWWLTLRVDAGIMDYYRWWIHSQRDVWGRSVHKTCEPVAKAHISVVRGEKPNRNIDKWSKVVGARFSFSYSHEVQTNGKHWWLLCESEQVRELREYLGLPVISSTKLHLTVAVTAT